MYIGQQNLSTFTINAVWALTTSELQTVDVQLEAMLEGLYKEMHERPFTALGLEHMVQHTPERVTVGMVQKRFRRLAVLFHVSTALIRK